MTGDGWKPEWRLLPQVRGDAVPLVTLCAHGGSKISLEVGFQSFALGNTRTSTSDERKISAHGG
jgi:hypothetical protein